MSTVKGRLNGGRLDQSVEVDDVVAGTSGVVTSFGTLKINGPWEGDWCSGGLG